nr:hypothetical protein CFP56_43682 [Quercus suber]
MLPVGSRAHNHVRRVLNNVARLGGGPATNGQANNGHETESAATATLSTSTASVSTPTRGRRATASPSTSAARGRGRPTTASPSPSTSAARGHGRPATASPSTSAVRGRGQRAITPRVVTSSEIPAPSRTHHLSSRSIHPSHMHLLSPRSLHLPHLRSPFFISEKGSDDAEKVVVVVKASKEIPKTALVWAWTHVVQLGDCITLLGVVPS